MARKSILFSILLFTFFYNSFSQELTGTYSPNKKVWFSTTNVIELNHVPFTVRTDDFKARLHGLELAAGKKIRLNTAGKFSFDMGLKGGVRLKNNRNDLAPLGDSEHHFMYFRLAMDDNVNHYFISLPFTVAYTVKDYFQLRLGVEGILYPQSKTKDFFMSSFIEANAHLSSFIGLSKTLNNNLVLGLNVFTGLHDFYSIGVAWEDPLTGIREDMSYSIKRNGIRLSVEYKFRQ